MPQQKGPVPPPSLIVIVSGAPSTNNASRPSKDGRSTKRRVQLREDEYTDFQEEIAHRRWTSLVTPKAKFDPEIVLEFYANAWPTEEGV